MLHCEADLFRGGLMGLLIFVRHCLLICSIHAELFFNLREE